MAGSSYIGGNLAEIGSASQKLNEAGTAAGDAGARTSRLAAQINGEVNDVATTLATHFSGVAADLNTAIQAAKANLGVTTWSGNARNVADSAEATLTTDVNTTLSSAQQAVEALKSQLLTIVGQFQADVDGQFNRVLTEINTSYGDLARGLTTYAQNLENVDANSLKVGEAGRRYGT